MTQRLPVPGKDSGQWGNILNDYLSQSHNADGTLANNVVGASQLQDSSVTVTKLVDSTITATKLAGNIPSTKLDSATQSQLSNVGTVPDGSVTNAKLDTPTQTILSTVASKYTKPGSGIPNTDLTATIQTSLGKADSALQAAPVTSVAGKTGAVSLAKADVGLTNVDNTSDASKPVSTAAQTALDTKATDTAVVHLAGTETITGAKDFTGGRSLTLHCSRCWPIYRKLNCLFAFETAIYSC